MPRPRREEFILDVRRSAKLQQNPNVETDSDTVDTDAISKILHSASLWLTPKVVEHYDPGDFADWPKDQQDHLHFAVYEFRKLAEQVAPNQPVTEGQYKEGVMLFRQLIRELGTMVLNEWTRAIDALERQTEEWSAQAKWRTRRAKKTMSESFIGPYETAKLLIYAEPNLAEPNLYVLDPVARFVPTAQGAFDFAVQPSYYSTSLYRDDHAIWCVHLDKSPGAANGQHVEWNKDTFYGCIEQLRAMA